MDRRQALLVSTHLAVQAATLACAPKAPYVAPIGPPVTRSLQLSSAATTFEIKGAFDATVTIRADSVLVDVETGTVFNTVATRPQHLPLVADLQLRAGLAVTDGRGWRLAATSAPVRVAAAMTADTAIAIRSVKFVIARPAKFDPARSWLVFQFAGRHVSGTRAYEAVGAEFTTYVCSTEFLYNPESPTASQPRFGTSPRDPC